jgi:ABC-type dipeptide/oligopeptide/nickel transport system permease subunit
MVTESLPEPKKRICRYTISNILMGVGIIITLAFVLVALFAPLMQDWGWLQDPEITLTNPIHDPPSPTHWFGTSRQGYDIFSRTLFGARAAWQVVLLATAMSVLVGVPWAWSAVIWAVSSTGHCCFLWIPFTRCRAYYFR